MELGEGNAMTSPAILAIIGAIALFVGVIGGGFTVK